MIKYASNSVLATMISFSNEIGNVCSTLGGVDVADVMRGVHLARYFTTTLDDGRTVKAPISSFLWAGCGYGGSCLPKDTKALSAHAVAHGARMPLLDAVIDTNLAQPRRMIALLEKHLPSLKGRRIALLGLAFKEDTDDMRESPAIVIAQALVERGARVIAYDPIAQDTARAVLPRETIYVDSLEEALREADAALLITPWEEFRTLPELIERRGDALLLIDGRRMIDPAAVTRYDGIGFSGRTAPY
jgi:UDPglucose 6-dehydrogenase/GDP-mannose 6-dehydrogenase